METNLIQKIKDLGLPENQYMVYGSAILEILGIREAKDIDLLVSPELFSELKNQGWKTHYKYNTTISHPEIKADAKQSLDFMKENYTLAEVLPNTYIQDEIPFMGLELLKYAKQQLGREKDLVDIKSIDEYLAKNT